MRVAHDHVPDVAYPNGMASIPFTLAALATSAVPGLTAVAVRTHGTTGGEFSSAILSTEDDEIIISVPRTPRAETMQSAGVLGLSALSEGARSQLPFQVPSVLGLTRAGDTRAVATTFLQGAKFEVADLEDDAILLASIAESIAAIHALPPSIVQQGGLPDRSPRDQRLLVTRMVDRAQATRRLPATVHRRWTEVLEASELWDFAPRVVHGSLSDDTLLVEHDSVVGVLDWSALAVGDPASDLAWLLEANDGVFDTVVTRYLTHSNSGDARALRSRALLYHELEIAKWLLHGVDTHDDSIVDDAVSMLDHLVDRMSILESAVPGRRTYDEASATELLEHTPEVDDRMSDTAAYEALDEDRMFGVDTDFIEPLADTDAADTDAADAAADADADDHMTEQHEDLTDHDTSEQLTQPIDPADLPTPKQRD